MQRLLTALLPLALCAPVAAQGLTIDSTKLDNGLDLIVVEKHNAPLVTIEIAVKTGSFTETPDTNGLSHLYEHMFFKGNAALPTQERYMARVAELGISFNGTTTSERVNYFFTLPSRNFAEGMQFMADAILTPLFNEEELKQERKVVIGEYDRNEATPTHYLWKGLREHMYGDQAYRKNPLGEREVILSATQETMRAFRRKFYVPNNAALLIVGDVNTTEAKVLAERLLGQRAWPRGADPHAMARKPLPRLSETKAFVVERETPVVVLSAQLPGPDVGRDERATFVADVWGTMCGLPHARFQRTFRDGGLATRASLGYFTQREGGEISFSAVVRDGKVYQVRDTFLAETMAMAEAGYFSEEDLALAKRKLRIDRAYEAEKGADLAHNLSFWWASSSLDYYTRYLEQTDTVTLDEVRAFVRNYVVGRPLVVGCLANKDNVEGLGLSADALRPQARAVAAASAVEELTLDNGLRVLFRREPASAVSSLQVFVDGSCLDLQESEQGVDKLLLDCVLDGSKRLERDAVLERMVELGAKTDTSTNYDSSRIGITAPNAGFPAAVELLAECLREPRFEPVAVTQRRSQMLATLGSDKSDPDKHVVRVLNTMFFAGHPYRLRPDGTPETAAELSADDLRGRLRELLVSGRLLLVMVGNGTGEEARVLLQKAFGFVPQGEFTRAALPPFQPSGPFAHEPREIPTTYVMGKCKAPAPGHADYPAMQLTLSLLRKRLWATLRTKHALTYAPSAGLSIYRTNYAVVSASTTKPARAVELMHEDIRRIQSELVSESELRGLTTQAEAFAYARSESAEQHAQALGFAELTSGSWRTHYEQPLSLAKVTPEDVRRVAKLYLKDWTWGLIGPAPVEANVLSGVERPSGGSW